MITVTIEGKTVCGTANDIAQILAEVERKTEGGTYFSDSKNEEMYIADMDTNHIRNAIRKMLRTWVEQLVNTADNELFVEEVECGIVDETFDNLLAELKNR
jgi:hypothetical protein